MALGMSYSEYWFGLPSLTKHYYNAHQFKIKQRNEELWLQGAYFYDALSAGLAAFGHALGGGKGAKPKGYMQKPFDIGEKSKEEKERLAKEEREKAIRSLNAWKTAWEQRYGSNS